MDDSTPAREHSGVALAATALLGLFLIVGGMAIGVYLFARWIG